MKSSLALAAALLSAAVNAQTPLDPGALRDAALDDELAWDITEGLTTEIGPRPAGSAAEARARDWGADRLRALGFQDVRIETFPVPVWERGTESAYVTAPFPQPLHLIALGNSGSTPSDGIAGEVAMFDSVAALEAASDEAVAGKIVYIGHAMRATQSGIGYGQFGAPRRQGPSIASRKGAAAIVVRSIGTDDSSVGHTGVQIFAQGVQPIPAAALANSSADQLERIAARGEPVRMRLVLTSRQTGNHDSGNVIAEVPGRDPDAGMVLVGCHLDSWDVGTGAIDDASGCGIVTAAAKRVMDAGTPRRPIRIVWFGSEEIGLFGGAAYGEAHADEKHALAAESDFGADAIWRFDSDLTAGAAPVAARMAAALAPLGIAQGPTDAAHGSDIGPLAEAGVGIVQLQQDGTRYFDWHHTAEDTLDKVDKPQLQQNVAAWTAMIAVAANAEEDMLAD